MNKKGSFTGLGKVYKFTLTQLLRTKANLISFGIFIFAALVSVPVMSFFMGGDGGEAATTAFYTDVMAMEDFLNRDQVGFAARYFIQYGYSIIVMMVCVFSCTYIVRSVLEEKSSKLVETLLVSIKSEAMILGKILAVMTFVFMMFALIIIAFALSYFGTSLFTDVSFVADTLEGMGLTKDLLNIGFGLLAVILVSVLLACVTLSLMAALAGAGCSNMEDLESANMSATMIILLCYMATVIVTPFGSGPAVFMSLCPFLSVFAAPTYYVTGDIGLGILLLSWAIQIVCILVIHRLSGKVYDSLIMYKGNRMKMGKILTMAMGRKGEK